MRRRQTRVLYFTISAVVITAAAMSRYVESAIVGGAGWVGRDAGLVSMSAGDVALDTAEAGPALRWLSDSGIVALVAGMQEPAIAAGRLQLQSWVSDTTMNLAIRLVRDHADYRVALDSLARDRRLEPRRPAVADSLLPPYEHQHWALHGLGVRELERRFVATQRQAHEQTIADLLALGALARDPELKALIAERAVRMEQDHLARFRDAERVLAEADSIARARRGGRGAPGPAGE